MSKYNRKSLNTKTLPIFSLLLIFLFSCQRDEKSYAWNNEILIPIGTTTFGVEEIMGNGVQKGAGTNELEVIYRQTFFDASANDLFIVPDTTLTYSFGLQTVRLSNNQLNVDIKLGEVYPAAYLLAGKTVAIPALEMTDATDFNIDATKFFIDADLIGGTMQVKIKNGLPVDLTYVKLSLLNLSDLSEISQFEFNYIKSGTTEIDTIPMAGKHVEGKMVARILQVNTDASAGPVLVNPNDAINLDISVKDLSAKRATAIFPAQEVLNVDRNVQYRFGGPEIDKMIVKSGELRIFMTSTINQDFFIKYEAPGLTTNGSHVAENFVLKAASQGTSQSEEKVMDLKGYEVDFRGRASEGLKDHNHFHNILIARMDSTGELKTLSLEDSVYVTYGLYRIIPQYAKGYMGNQSKDFNGNNFPIAIGHHLKGIYNLEQATISIFIENGWGINANINLKNIGITNSNGNKIPLSGDFLNSPLGILDAIESPYQAWDGIFVMDASNSNIIQLLQDKPVSINADVNLEINPEGNNNNYQDFFSIDNKLNAGFEINIPLNVKFKDFRFIDTLDFELTDVDLNRIDNCVLNLITYNKFQMAFSPKLYGLDIDNQIVDSFTFNDQWAAAANNNQGGNPKEMKSVLKQNINSASIESLTRIKKMILKVGIETDNSTGFTQVKSNENLRFIITAQLNLKNEIEI